MEHGVKGHFHVCLLYYDTFYLNNYICTPIAQHMHVLVPWSMLDSVCINHLIRSYMDALNQRGLAYNSLLLLNLIYLMDAVWDES